MQAEDLQVVADLISTNAVQIKPGASVHIDGWGGPALRGKVTRVDPGRLPQDLRAWN